jgi:NAD(P)-dependent dehydrogenase (short-subunit alcohol dehydrogenase family)
MDLKLRGKRAVVTGSTAGIGFAIAQGLARGSSAITGAALRVGGGVVRSLA